MDDIRWPAAAIQIIFLSANLAFFLTGKFNNFLLVFFTIIIFLFITQTLSSNPRFRYLFPVDSDTRTPMVSIDTYILRISLVTAFLCFFIGSTGKLIFSLIIVFIGLLFPFYWDNFKE